MTDPDVERALRVERSQSVDPFDFVGRRERERIDGFVTSVRQEPDQLGLTGLAEFRKGERAGEIYLCRGTSH